MADTTSTAEIRVVADASGVEAGLRPAIDAAQRAERAISGIGDNSVRSQQNLIRAIERTTAQLEAGGRSGARYFEILGRQRGIDPNVLRPYIEQLRAVEEAQRRAASGANETAATIKDVLGSAVAGLSLLEFLQSVVSAQREFDKLNASLVTATGSTEKAAEAFAALEKFAATTPYGVAEATEAFIKMRNLGLDPSERALRSYGNTAAAMGKNLGQMVEAVADASTGEFERLKEFGIKASQNGEKVTLTFKGTSTTIKNESDEIEKYLIQIGEVDFAGAMIQRAATLDGAISQLADSWDSAMRTISSSGIGQAAQDGVIGLSASLNDLETILLAISEAADKQGEKLNAASAIHKALTTVFEAVSVLGLNVVYVFKQVGNEIAGLAAQATAVATGNFTQARIIGEQMKAEAEQDRKEVDRQTAAILGAVENAKKAAANVPKRAPGEDPLAQFRIQREAERQSAEAARERANQIKREAAALAELAGLTSTFASDWKMLSTLYGHGSISLERLTKAQADLLAKQPAMKAAAEQELAARKALDDFTKSYVASLSIVSDIYVGRIREAEDEAASSEELARVYGMSRAAIEEQTLARLEDQLAQRSTLGLTLDEIETLEKLIAAKRRSVAALRDTEVKDAAKAVADDWKRAAESMEQSLTDALMRGFESGKSFGRNLVDTVKNMFNTLVLRPIVSAVVNPVAGAVTSALGLPSAASAATGAMGSAAGSAIGAGLGIGGAMSAFTGTLATGFMNTIAGTGLSAGLTAGGAMIGGGSIASGLGMIAGALGPIALGIGAGVALLKKFDDSGTAHTGGASRASSAGVSTIRAESLGFQHTKVSSDANSMTAQLASGIVNILDSTALTFGKTAGYTAATAFADDTSKDGAWGALVIQKLGQDIVDWSDTRTSRWAPKEFADGEKGQAQYLAALSSSVRTALNSIGLPEWARTMLNGIASDASIEDLAKVVEQINATQSALAAMRAQLVGFSSLGDAAVSALMAASGGIEKLFSNASAYYDAFYTEAEKNAAASQQIAKALAAVNLQMPASREGFRALVEAQMRLGTQGAEALSVLLGVAGAFAQVTPEVQAATADLTSHRSALTEAYNAEAEALQSTISRMGSFATSLRNLNSSALLGNLSPLSPSQKYAEAKSQYEAVLLAARAGDEGAQGRYQEVYTAFLEASRTVNASSIGYTRDFEYAQAATEEAAKWAEKQVDVYKAQLDVLKLQVSGIIEVNKSVLSVRDALLQYNAAAGKNTAPLTAVAPPVNTPIPYSSYGTSNTEALVAEVKSLRTEVAGLRADQRQQTGDLIRGGASASRESAQLMGRITESAITSLNRFNDRVAPE